MPFTPLPPYLLIYILFSVIWGQWWGDSLAMKCSCLTDYNIYIFKHQNTKPSTIPNGQTTLYISEMPFTRLPPYVLIHILFNVRWGQQWGDSLAMQGFGPNKFGANINILSSHEPLLVILEFSFSAWSIMNCLYTHFSPKHRCTLRTKCTHNTWKCFKLVP